MRRSASMHCAIPEESSFGDEASWESILCCAPRLMMSTISIGWISPTGRSGEGECFLERDGSWSGGDERESSIYLAVS